MHACHVLWTIFRNICRIVYIIYLQIWIHIGDGVKLDTAHCFWNALARVYLPWVDLHIVIVVASAVTLTADNIGTMFTELPPLLTSTYRELHNPYTHSHRWCHGRGNYMYGPNQFSCRLWHWRWFFLLLWQHYWWSKWFMLLIDIRSTNASAA